MGEPSMQLALNHNEMVQESGPNGQRRNHHQRALVNVTLKNPYGRDVGRDPLSVTLNQGVVSATVLSNTNIQYQVVVISQKTEKRSDTEDAITVFIEIIVL